MCETHNPYSCIYARCTAYSPSIGSGQSRVYTENREGCSTNGIGKWRRRRRRRRKRSKIRRIKETRTKEDA